MNCEACTRADERNATEAEVWRDEHWRVTVAEPTGSPLVLILQPLAHHDFTDLPDDLAGQMGRIMVHLGAAVETLPSVARVHVSKWGDGGAHAHVFFFARPARMPQLRGTCMALWDDVLPPVPTEVRDANARAVVAELVRRYGGRPLGVAERPRPAARHLSARGPRNRRERLRSAEPAAASGRPQMGTANGQPGAARPIDWRTRSRVEDPVSELHVELVAADRKVWEGEAREVIARTMEGELGILPGHTPLLGILVEGDVRIRVRVRPAAHRDDRQRLPVGRAQPGHHRRRGGRRLLDPRLTPRCASCSSPARCWSAPASWRWCSTSPGPSPAAGSSPTASR